MPTGLQPLSSSAAAALNPQQQLSQLLMQQQQQQQHLQHQHQHNLQQFDSGGAKRFKPLSIMVPDNQAHPILPSGVTPLTGPTPMSGGGPGGAASGMASASAAGGVGMGGTGGRGGPAGLAGGSGAPALNGHFLPHSQQQHQSQHQQQAQHQQQQGQQGLPPRAPSSSGRPFGAGRTSLSGIASALAAAQQAAGAAGGGAAGSGPMDTDGGGGAFTFDRRTLTGALDDLGISFAPMRMSSDGSAAAMLSMPSPPPHGATAALFGALDGGPLSVRSSSHGMLAALGMGSGMVGLERGTSVGLSGLLESPGPMALDSSLRGLAPMDVLDWPSSSPRWVGGWCGGEGCRGVGAWVCGAEGWVQRGGWVGGWCRGVGGWVVQRGGWVAGKGPCPDERYTRLADG